jgi:GntR family transcriptional repressor for pyruvate dehydrogenase complex
MGVVDTRHGSGTQLARSGSNVLRTPLQFLLMLDQPSITDLHETRELIDVYLAGRAAQRRTPPDLVALQTELRDLEAALERRQGYTEPDFRFHKALWAAAHHPILERIMSGLQENIVELMDVVRPDVHDFRASYEIHERIYDAIRRGNVRRARREMATHHAWMVDELRHAKLIP